MKDLANMEPSVGEDGVDVYSFQEYVYSPIGGFGVITLNKTYKKIFAQKGGTDVGIGMDIIGVTTIDSIDKIVGLKIFLSLDWEDNRLNWPIGSPKPKQEWEFDSKILK